MTGHTRREIIAGGLGSLAVLSGCLSGADATEADGGGPAQYPDSDTSFDDRAVLTSNGGAVYKPRSVDVIDKIPIHQLGTGLPAEWDTGAVDAVEPVAGRRLVYVEMEYTNRGEGPNDAPAVGSSLGVRSAGDSPVMNASVDEFPVVPVGSADHDLWDLRAYDAIAHKADYALNGNIGGWSDIGPGETVTGWFVSTVPPTLTTDEIHPAMGSGESRFDLPAQWANGYDVTERYTNG